MNTPLWRVAPAALLVGCVTVRYRVEFDRMTDTAFPADQVLGGATHSLETIYENPNGPGLDFTVVPDQTDIAALAGTYVSNAELDALETADRTIAVGMTSCGDKCNEYHVYGIVTDHLYEDQWGIHHPGVLGIMWPTDCRAFAMMYQNGTVSSDNGKYLRSAAHEIGHAFNMHHEDGDGSTTIMNQTGTVGDTYDYVFSTESLEHLSTHPTNCKRPGVATFGTVGTTHDDHGWTTVGCP